MSCASCATRFTRVTGDNSGALAVAVFLQPARGTTPTKTSRRTIVRRRQYERGNIVAYEKTSTMSWTKPLTRALLEGYL